jgi:hypothetical protein
MFGELDTRAPVVLEQPEFIQDDIWGRDKQALDFNVDGSSARLRFREFFRNFQLDNIFIYREGLLRNWNRRELYIEVDLAHLNEFDEVLFNNLSVKYICFLFQIFKFNYAFIHFRKSRTSSCRFSKLELRMP